MVCKTWCCFIWTECSCKNVNFSMDTLVRPNGGQALCLTMTTHPSSLLSFVLLLLLLLRVSIIDWRMLSSSSSTILFFFSCLLFIIASATYFPQSCCMWIGDTRGVRMHLRSGPAHQITICSLCFQTVFTPVLLRGSELPHCNRGHAWQRTGGTNGLTIQYWHQVQY